jgi:hypothetical protein
MTETKCPLCDPLSSGEDIQICAHHQAELCTTIDMKKAILDACIDAYIDNMAHQHPVIIALDRIARGY